MDKIDWLILNELSDDFESMNQIYPLEKAMQAKRRDIIDRIEILIQKGLIKLLNDVDFDKETLLAEPENYPGTEFWFGLTEKGAGAFEKHAKKFDGSEIDWSGSYCIHRDFSDQTGYVEGTSEKVCLSSLSSILDDDEWIIDMTSLKHSDIPGFQAKYYKYLSGGHRIDFRIKKK
ncbi:MAG TPA: hypothetical protein DCZ94_10520 [Lentisphaeria bacterium]|nr:MAG: hypothetical protein A2X48_06395 [Lentisphaerae bacterium GWF2_49_21]HBC87378.1 hypothetical protein [Lentisphaeria bacterium]